MPGVSRHDKPALQRAGFSFVLLSALALTALPSLAQVHATGDYLSRMDSDGDGRIALPEFQDWMSYAFSRMDVDGDGVLTPAELPGGRGKPVSLVEHRQTLAQTFARQDRNKDGYLDARELASPPQ
ncbi:MAG TPA: hypothetical protein VIT62_14925 [Lysobacter sp.]